MSKLRPAAVGTIDPSPRYGGLALSSVPRLLWPSVEYGTQVRACDFVHFPDAHLVEHRNTVGGWQDHDEPRLYLSLIAFTSAVENSVSCILVLDPHFDKVGVDALAPAMESSSAKDIWLLTGGSKRESEEWRQTLEEYRNWDRAGSHRTQVRWSTRLDKNSFPFLHDRFAVVDGGLWHFGSTAGGGHRGLTAASGPWPEDDTRGKLFFEECWRRLHA